MLPPPVYGKLNLMNKLAIAPGRSGSQRSNSQKQYRIGIDLSVTDRVKTGTSVYAIHLYQSLVGLDQDLFTFIPLKAPRPLPRKNILTKFCNLSIELLWLNVLLPLQIHRHNLDLLHMPANIISPPVRRPQICTIHDAHFITNPQGRDRLWRLYASWSFHFAARHADRIICDSNSGKDEIVRYLDANPDNIDVVYLGLPERSAVPEDKRAAAALTPYILSVGGADSNKNLPALIRAYGQLAASGRTNGCKLVLAGPPGGDSRVIGALIQELGLEDHVKIMGMVSDSMLAALYENAFLFAFPSLCEGFGFPPLEAMQFGVPVIASNAPCIPETLDQAALYFDPYNVDDMAEKIHLGLIDSKLRERLSQAGLSRSKQFSWERSAEKTLEVYRNLLAREHDHRN